MTAVLDTPILFLIFNRPDTTQDVFLRIRAVKPKFLFVAADGPREDNDSDKERCQQAREIINQVDWDCKVFTRYNSGNLGCGRAVSTALSWFFEQVEYGIVLEDDCLPADSFFWYCQELLIKYRYDDQIMHIGGNNFQNGLKGGSGSYYFSRYPHIWGWASWRRAWKFYDFALEKLSQESASNELSVLSSRVEKKYFLKKLLKVKAKKIDTWDYQWTFSIFGNNGLCISPNSNLVLNLGFRNVATHYFLRDSYREVSDIQDLKFPLSHPAKIVESEADKRTFENVFGLGFVRIIRIVRENSMSAILKYVLLKRLFR